jgi:hypothetical protein
MPRNAEDALLSFIRADQGHPLVHHDDERRPPVVTVARDHGAGGEEIAQLLAKRLGVPCYDKQILDGIVERAEEDASLMRSLDEKVPPREGLFLFAAMLGLSDPLTKYQRLLTRVLNAIPFGGGVIVGRGAHYVLQNPYVLRVRIVGTEEICAKRLGGGDKALEEVRKVNDLRGRYHKDVFNTDSYAAHHYDLTLNTDRFTSFEAAAELIAQAYAAVVPAKK